MKSLIFFLLPIAIHGRAIEAEKRQLSSLGGGLGIDMLSSILAISKPAKVEQLTPQVRNTARRARILWGPYDFKPANATGGSSVGALMPGMQMDPNGQITMKRLAGFCTDCTVIHGATYVANADGSRVHVKEGAYLHHLLILNPTKKLNSYYRCSKDGAAPVQQNIPSSYFLGSGVDQSEYFFTTPDGKYNSGYYIGKSDSFMMQSEIVNYSPKAQKWYIAADYEYILGKPAGAEDVSVTDFNVNNCFGFLEAGYHPPNGEQQFSKISPKFIMSQDGTILHAMGHLHDGGTNIQLLVNDKVVCDSKATYGGDQGTLENSDGSKWETISSMTSCRDPIPVKKGDVLTIASFYNTQLHPLRESTNGQMMEEMGIYTLFFASKGI